MKKKKRFPWLLVLILVAWLLPSPISGGKAEPTKSLPVQAEVIAAPGSESRAAASGTGAQTRSTPTPRPSPTPAPTPRPTPTPSPAPVERTYVLNTNSHKFHYPTCSSVGQMKESNKLYYDGTREEIIAMGYDPCGRCHP